MFINFSIKPIRIVTFIGLITAIICVALGLYFFIDKMINPDSAPIGWASLVIIVLFLGSIQLIGLGIAGEYIGKTYLDKNGTPQWVIKKKSYSEN